METVMLVGAGIYLERHRSPQLSWRDVAAPLAVGVSFPLMILSPLLLMGALMLRGAVGWIVLAVFAGSSTALATVARRTLRRVALG